MTTNATLKPKPMQKITVEVPRDLRATGKGISQTVRSGLELVAASDVYAQLRAMRGKLKFDMTWQQVKDRA